MKNQYRALKCRSRVLLIFFFLLLTVIGVLSLCIGASSISVMDSILALIKDNGMARAIVLNLRLPRVFMAGLIGIGLGTAGAVFQAVLRNPLASPFTLGIGSSAGFGAVVTIIFFNGLVNEYAIVTGAFVFTLLSSFVVLGVSRYKGTTAETMILTGIALMFLFSSLSSFLQYLGTKEEVHGIVFWFFGSLSKAGYKEIILSGTMILVPIPFILRFAFDFNLMTAGDESAGALGVNVPVIRMLSIALASLMTAGAICFTGVIGFIGLVAPHIARMIFGSDHLFLIPASALIGAVLVLAADTLGRTLWLPHIIPIGIVTSFIGVPFFLFLLIRKTKEYW
ncbi:MAG: iron ABC transporter permease [Proteobacteria bacterium]|nr:iron ABC transporter permease [Pseudomonadota bacterium]MBU1584834.1 iron ABC transporter permease [Pseudomonadota bacterium]MBU2452551.1 iron ABC transporter permease [Pseudomonadota bacterium]MBU2632049.1 iron ABC transporter permease [Pseudomonadota bacterium]